MFTSEIFASIYREEQERKRLQELENKRRQQEEIEREQEKKSKKMIEERLVSIFPHSKGYENFSRCSHEISDT